MELLTRAAMFGFGSIKKLAQLEIRILKRVGFALLVGGVGGILYGLTCLRQGPPPPSAPSKPGTDAEGKGDGAGAAQGGKGKSVSYFGGMVQLDDVRTEGTSESHFKAKGAATGFWKAGSWSWHSSTSETASPEHEQSTSKSASGSESWSGKVDF